MSDVQPADNVSMTFLATIKPTPARRTDRPVVEDDEYCRMLWRMVRGAEARAVQNPEMLTQIIALAQRMSEIANVAIAAQAERYQEDPRRGASLHELAKIMGMSRQAVQQRAHTGRAVMERRIESAIDSSGNVVRFAEAARERAAMEAAAEHAEAAFTPERLTEVREYRARHLRVA